MICSNNHSVCAHLNKRHLNSIVCYCFVVNIHVNTNWQILLRLVSNITEFKPKIHYTLYPFYNNTEAYISPKSDPSPLGVDTLWNQPTNVNHCRFSLAQIHAFLTKNAATITPKPKINSILINISRLLRYSQPEPVSIPITLKVLHSSIFT